MNHVKQICIFGYDTLIGRHLEKEFMEMYPNISLKFWQYKEPFQEYPNYSNILYGFNSIDHRDLSLTPSRFKMCYINETIPMTLANECQRNGNIPLIHLSTTLVQLSTKWPNVSGREKDVNELNEKEIPFYFYTKSKINIEKYLTKFSSVLPILIIRTPFYYGEGDSSSVVIDALKFFKNYNYLPLMDENNGIFEMSYVGNIANGMIACGDKLLTNNISGEIVILGDNTRNKNVRESVIDKILSNNKREKIESSKWPLTNTFFIILYKIFAFFVRIFNLQNLFICLPDPDYLVLHFSNWTFFNKYKLEYFINWKQKYSYEEAIEKSRKYYTSIPNPLDLPYSWESHPF